MILLAIDILAVHDPCLVRMQFEAAFSEAFVNSPQHELRLRLTLAVDDRIIGVAAEPHARQSAIDPDAKSIVQEQIARSGETTPPCGAPLTLALTSPSVVCNGALSQRSTYSKTQGIWQCFLTARIRRS